MHNRSSTAWAVLLADQLSRYKHPESFEIVSVGPRDDSGKVRRTLLRDERAAWLKEGRAFRIMPLRGPAKPVE
jgi:bile acid-coenzyme A ligase